MTQSQLLNEFRRLPLQQQLDTIQEALRIVAQRLQLIEESHRNAERRQVLPAAANLLLADYLEDRELTSFTALDGEPFDA